MLDATTTGGPFGGGSSDKGIPESQQALAVTAKNQTSSSHIQRFMDG